VRRGKEESNFVQNNPDLPTWFFLHYFLIFKQLYKMILFAAVFTSGKKTHGHCAQGDYEQNGNQTHFTKRRRDTRTVKYGRNVLNRGISYSYSCLIAAYRPPLRVSKALFRFILLCGFRSSFSH
jgi:hypothetical protein